MNSWHHCWIRPHARTLIIARKKLIRSRIFDRMTASVGAPENEGSGQYGDDCWVEFSWGTSCDKRQTVSWLLLFG